MPIRDFPFIFFHHKDPIARPFLPIKIINPLNGQSLRVMGLIDTGADECAIPALFAQILDHDLHKGEPKVKSTAGGQVTAYSHETKIEIYDLSNNPCYTINNTPVDFMPGLNVVLLGVKQFLDQFELLIQYPQKIFSIKQP